MSIKVNDNFFLRAPKPLDDRIGEFSGGVWNYPSSVAAFLANTAITPYRYPSMTVAFMEGGVQNEYWFVGGVEDSDFKLKLSGIEYAVYEKTGMFSNIQILIDSYPAGTVINLLAGHEYSQDNSILMKQGTFINGNGATLKRTAETTALSTTSVSVGGTFVTVDAVPAGWEVGDLLQLYTDTTYLTSSYKEEIIIESIVGNVINFVNAITRSANSGTFTWPIGSTVRKIFSQITSETESIDGLFTFPTDWTVTDLILDGNMAENGGNFYWGVNMCVKNNGHTLLQRCSFINMPNENIFGTGYSVVNSHANNLNGSFIHQSGDVNKGEDILGGEICGNIINDTNIKSSNLVNGHSEGVITFSYTSGRINIHDNRFIKGGESVLGSIAYSLNAQDGSNVGLDFHDNYCEDFSKVVAAWLYFEPFNKVVDNLQIKNNIFSNCGEDDWSSYTDMINSMGNMKFYGNALTNGTIIENIPEKLLIENSDLTPLTLQDVTSNGSVTTTGATFGGKLIFGTGTYALNTGSLYNTANNGTELSTKKGTVNDFVLWNSVGSPLLRNPTDTLDMAFTGGVTVASAPIDPTGVVRLTELNLKEDKSNKAINFTIVNNTLYPTVQAVKAYADALVVGLLDDRGSYNASSNVFPSTGGSGTAGAILKGDLWFVSVAGTLGGQAVNIGDSFRALIDSPGQTAGNWNILEANIGYVPENILNKVTDFTTVNNTLYPTTQAIVNFLGNYVTTNTNQTSGITGNKTWSGNTIFGGAVDFNSGLNLKGGFSTAYYNSTNTFSIQFNGPASLTANRSVTLQNANGIVALTDGTGATGTWPISVTGNSATTSAVSGTVNFIPKFSSTTVIGNSQLFDNGTNTGIGTTSPQTKFDVNGGSVFEVTNFYSSFASGGNNYTTIKFGTVATPAVGVSGGLGYYEKVGDLGNSGIFLVNHADNELTGSIFLKRGGNVGIGTSSPTERLSVVGKALVSVAPTDPTGVLRYTDLGTGWAQYTDTVYTSGSPLVINAGATTTITNNAATTLSSQLPIGVTSFYNSGTSKITPQNDGDSYLINVRFTAVSSSTSGLADIAIDIGGAMNIIVQETISLRKGIGQSQRVNIEFDVFSGSTFIANGGLIKLNSIDGNTSIYDISYKVTRTHKAK